MLNKVHQIVTDQIIKQLEEGKIPWRKPWGGAENEPKNLISKKEYSGINFFLLSMLNMDSPYFLTYKQAKLCGGTVKKGEKGFPIIFFKIQAKEKNLKGETTKEGFAMMRYYTVFNLNQCENIDDSKIPFIPVDQKLDFIPLNEAEKLIEGYKGRPPVEFKKNKACYFPTVDKINMPLKENFIGTEEFYSTLFHEMVHSTGHQKRLNRPEIVDLNYFGSTDYSKEELVAELGAAFLCSKAGIDNTLQNSAAYIQSWLKCLKSKDNVKWIVEAGSKAQKAVNYIHNQEK